ncbi:APC family permease [Blastopirellula marina]|uniref:Amino acid permease ykbA-like protein n=1 Tax=Blastopirellula marina DSM 3645 TaxID=314230 RepID=A3ZMF1_9BACT|nr:APC family permease [Blastopirellula marina]EAQ82124.1 amino acid permease ykbA-like protein [Blastopirellula marina DSM 3645]
MSDRRAFGLWTLTFLVIANMVGAGVFTTSGYTLASVGSPGWVVIAWLVGGLIALMGALSYGQLSRVMPESGGEYLFLSQALHPAAGFVGGWISLLAGFTGAIAYAAITLEKYVMHSVDLPFFNGAVAIVTVGICGLLHGLGTRLGAGLQNVVVLLKLALLGLFLFLAASSDIDWQGAPLAIDQQPEGWDFALAFGNSLIWIAFCYLGFNAAVYVASEAKNAGDVPRSLLLGTVIVVVLYVLLNSVFVYAPLPGAIANQAEVAAIAAEAIGGKSLSQLVSATIVIALFTSVMSMIMAAPRVYAKMADDGFLHHSFRAQESAPQTAIALQSVLAIGMILFYSHLKDLLDYLGLTLSLCAALTVACALLPAVRQGPLLRLASLPPVLYLLGTLVSALLMAINKPWALLPVAITFGLGGAVFLAIRGRAQPVIEQPFES